LIENKTESERISFTGEWEENIKVRGVIIYRNGDKYEGQLYNDQPHGKGVKTYDKGSVYSGDYKNGEKNGSGTLNSRNGKIYDGSWHNNKKNGII